jgi:hypothetical protein
MGTGKRPFLDTSHINEKDGMSGPDQYFVSIVVPSHMNQIWLKRLPKHYADVKPVTTGPMFNFNGGTQNPPPPSPVFPQMTENQKMLYIPK